MGRLFAVVATTCVLVASVGAFVLTVNPGMIFPEDEIGQVIEERHFAVALAQAVRPQEVVVTSKAEILYGNLASITDRASKDQMSEGAEESALAQTLDAGAYRQIIADRTV